MAHDDSRRGVAAEQYAAKLLVQKGYTILETNYRSRVGEIDIIATTENLIVFVEVKQRTGERYGLAEEAVDPPKIQRILETADVFLLERPQYRDHIWRLDLVAITLNRDGTVSRLQHIENLIVD